MGTGAPSNSQTVSHAVLSAVADQEGIESEQLAEPLFEVVDPDALNSLFQTATGQVTFEYHDYVVTVDHDRRVEVVPAPQGETPAEYGGESTP